MLKTLKIITALFTAAMLWACSDSTKIQPVADSVQYKKTRTLDNFNDYVVFLKGKAAAQGVSAKTLNAQQNILYIDTAVRLDKKQAGNAARKKNQPPLPPNPNGLNNYLTKHLTQAKVNKAQAMYWGVQSPVQRASKKYGVQEEFLMALWGMESSFGYYQGTYDVLSVLATLAFDGRREALFSKEFINALKMLDQGYLSRHKMLGSWAGAMGQTQFMPTSYLNYAADGNNDGAKDIWKNEYDVFASIANYLHTVGWDDKLPWGVEVNLTQYIDLSQSGTDEKLARSFNDWQKMGIQLKNYTEASKWQAMQSTKLWLVRPDKDVGRAFLVTNNFRTILDWNRSNYYAISVGQFADRIKAVLVQ